MEINTSFKLTTAAPITLSPEENSKQATSHPGSLCTRTTKELSPSILDCAQLQTMDQLVEKLEALTTRVARNERPEPAVILKNSAHLISMLPKLRPIANTGARIVQLDFEKPTTQALDLNKCSQLCDETLEAIVNQYTGLEYLYLNSCERLQNSKIAGNALKHILLSDCTGLTSVTIQAESSLELSFNGCAQLEKLTLATKCEKPISLNIDGCIKLSGDSLKAIPEQCPNIQLLSLQDCTQFTGEVLVDLVSRCPKLEYLCVKGCTPEAIAHVRKEKDLLREIDLDC